MELDQKKAVAQTDLPQQYRIRQWHTQGYSLREQAVVRLTGLLDTDRLIRCFRETLVRHGLLTETTALTAFRVDQWNDDTADSESFGETLMLRNLDGLADNAPALRGQVVQQSAMLHWAVIDIAADLADSQSVRQLIQESCSQYYYQASALSEGASIDYAQYADWQHELLTDPEALAFRDTYQGQMGHSSPLPLTTATNPAPRRLLRHAIPTDRTLSDFWLTQPADEAADWLLACWAALLQKHSGQPTIGLGQVIANRPFDALEGTVGPVAKVIPLSLPLPDDCTPNRLLSELARLRDDRMGWQEVLHSNQNQAYLVGFQLIDYPNTAPDLTSVAFGRPLSYAEPFGLKLCGWRTQNRIDLTLEADASHYDLPTLEILGEQFMALSEQFVTQPNTPIAALSALSVFETSRILTVFNPPISNQKPANRVVDQFVRQAALTPDRLALRDWQNQMLTYRQLDERSNQLAHYLIDTAGLQPGQLVGLLADRSMNTLVGLLAIHKAGGAYVPIDPAYPAPRIAYILADAQPVAVLTDSPYLNLLSDYAGALVALDIQLDILDTATSPVKWQGNGDDLAYVLYTSGSTGQPKGCQIEQHSLSNYVNWANDYYFGAEQTGQFGLFSSLAFDFTITCIFCPLVAGGRIDLFDPQAEVGEVLARLFGGQNQVDTVKLTPSHITLLQHIDLSRSQIRTVIVGGEELLPKHLEILKRLGSVAVYNEYGPTEATVGCVVKLVDLRQSVIPIGRPIRQTNVYVVDAETRLLPIGMVGELVISGSGLARGYLNQLDLTASKFAADPFRPGNRIYHTGDLCRWLPNGELQYLGRNDHQVKIDGNRVELGEVECQLLTHPDLAEAVVRPYKAADQSTYLAAFVVPANGATVPVSADLRQHLNQRVPAYMIPAFFVPLTGIPLTVNGKVDTAKLPEPETHLGRSAAYVAPTTSTEIELATIWTQVLGKERISVYDNFFDLGGNSLKAVQITQRVESLGGTLRLADVFSRQTVRAIAELLDQGPLLPALTTPSTIVPLPAQATYEVSPAQRRLWVLRQLETTHALYNMPGVYELGGPLQLPAFERAIQQLIVRHESLRTTFVVVDQVLQQRINDPKSIDIEVVNLQKKPNTETLLLDIAHAEATTSFDLEQGPLVRVKLVQLAPDRHVLLFTAHHIISDGWSVGVLLREALQLYTAFVAGLPNPLLPLPFQYRDVAAWQRSRQTDGRHQQHRAYWLDRFSGELPVLNLPTDRPRPLQKTFRGATLEKTLTPGLHEALTTFGIAHELSHFSVLMTAMNVLLFRYSGQTDLIVGTTVAGREHPGLANQVGFYVNTLALRTQLSGSDSFATLLGRVHQHLLDAYDNQAYPFDELVDELKLARDPSHSPLFDVLVEDVSLSSRLSENEPNNALTVRPFEVPYPFSKYDLTVKFVVADGRVGMQLEYNTELFEATRMKTLLVHFEQLLQQVLLCEDVPVGQIDFVTDTERADLLRFGTGPKMALPLPSLLEMLTRQVSHTPGKVAILAGTEQLSYAQLLDQAYQLANYLKTDCSLKRGDTVALLADRTERFVVGVLGVLAAGGAFLPIDPDYPADRCQFLLTDSRATVLLADSTYLPKAGEFGGQLFALDIQLSMLPDEAPVPAVYHATNDRAYVIYTSGSTGQPKGVAISMGNLMNYLVWANRHYFSDQAGWPMGLFTSLSFDLTITSLFTPLLRGDAVHLYAEGDAGSLLTSVFGSESVVRVAKITPSHINLLALLPITQTPIDCVIVGGEALLPQQVRHLRQLNPAMLIFNEYGPTETTVGCTVQEVSSPDHISIGKPIANTQVYVLTPQLGLQPVGHYGELYVGGEGVGQGYVGQPDLTEAKFVANPFRSRTRLYRTGDWCRWLPNGELYYLGRRDNQLKINGYRIEPGEIEQVISRLPDVQGVVVTTRANPLGELALVAYYTANQPCSPTDLRQQLGQQLPAHLIPARLLLLPSLPVTINGKIDHAALPDPWKTETGADESPEDLPPFTTMEQAVADAWQLVLGLPITRTDSHFFALGGDSIKAIRLVSALQQNGLNGLEVKDVFLHQTVSAQAAFLATQSVAPAEPANHPAEQTLLSLRESILADPVLAGHLPADWEDLYPMTDIQTGMVYHSLLKPESGTYHDQLYTQFTEARFDLNRFQRAFQLLTERHAILRTSFDMRSFDQPMQLVHRWTPGPDLFDYQDLRATHSDSHKQQIETYLAADRNRPLATDRPCLWRVALFQRTDTDIGFVFICHHAIIDGWSYASLLAELSNTYYALLDNPAYQPTPLPTTYRDYVVDQLTLQTDPMYATYWRDTLTGYERTQLPFGRRPNPTSEPKKASFRYVLPAATTQTIQTLSARHRLSPHTVCLSAFLCLLRATTNQTDLMPGVVTSGRPEREGGDQILGCFLNTIPFRFTLSEPVSGQELLLQVGQQSSQLKAYDKLSLARIAEGLGEQAEGQNPLFDVVFHYVDFHIIEQRHALTQAKAVPDMGHAVNNTAFDFLLDGTGDQILLTINYEQHLYETADTERLATYFVRLIDWLAQDNQPFVSSLLLDETERQRLVDDYNQTAYPLPEPALVTDRLAQQVTRTPLAPAVCAGPQCLSYADLNEAADRLAWLLQHEYEVCPGDRVALQLNRSPWLLVGLLGILKTGASFLPIDPDYPETHRELLIREGGAKALLIDSELLTTLGDQPVPLLAAEVQLAGVPTGTRPDPVTIEPDSCAYVIFTSGSTGRPKGVMVSHRNLANYLSWANHYYVANESGHDMALFTSVAFDLTITSLFTTLLRGDAIRLFAQTDPAQLLRAVFDPNSGVRVAKLTPSHITVLGQLDLGSTAVEQVIVGGEALESHHLRVLRALNPAIRIDNEYGPTETTVGCTVKEIGDEPDSITIGWPIANTRIYVLDQHLNLLPEGVGGEICVGGEGVALGYLNDPTLTATKFVADPFVPGGRLYRTGDLGRWLPNGELDYLGRLDNQVKLHGFRLELGSVKTKLTEHPAVTHAEVDIRRDTLGMNQLVAYVAGPNEESMPELWAFIRTQLPTHAWPTELILLTEIPLTTHGKIDHHRLPKPGLNANTPANQPALPTNATEQLLVAIWSDVLGRAVGVHDNFFEHGGHSINAVQIMSRIEKQTGLAIELRHLFDAQTIAKLAVEMSTLRRQTQTAIYPLPEAPHYALSAAQRRLWVFQQFDKQELAYQMTAGFALHGSVDTVAFKQAILALTERHESLRTRFEMVDGTPVQVVMPTLPANQLDVEDCRDHTDPQQAVTEAITQEHNTPFDLAVAPLFRARLLRLADTEWAFLFTIHHIVSDNWSIEVLTYELITFYNAFCCQSLPVLPTLPIQYKDYAAWQNAHLATEGDRQRAYWLRQLGPEPPVLNLPTDYRRPAVKQFQGNTVRFGLDNQTRTALESYGQRQGASLFMVLTTAINAWLHRYTGQVDLIVGMPVAGRDHAELEQQLGCFVNVLPLRTQILPDDTFGQLLGRVKRTTLDLLAHQSYPFDQLVDDLNLSRDLSRSPLFDVLVVMQQRQRMPEVVAPTDLRVSEWPITNPSSRFDLTINLIDQPDGFVVDLDYDTSLFSPERVERMGQQLQNLLVTVLTDDSPLLRQLDYLPDAEKAKLLSEFNANPVNYSPEQTLHELIEKQANLRPDQPALVSVRGQLTYSALNERANQLARYLQIRYGIGSNDTVAVRLTDAETLVISLLAIWKAGAVYLPISPEHPLSRAAFVLTDSGAKLMFCADTEAGLFADFCATADPAGFVFTDLVTNLPLVTDPTDRAYVIYTSGSTGQPKGVPISHRSLCDRILYHTDYLNINETDTVLQFASVAFDASLIEIGMALASGGKLALIDAATKANLHQLVPTLGQLQVTTAIFPPAYLKLMNRQPLPSLKRMISTGEAAILDDTLHYATQLDMVNGYGPTETCVGATFYRVDPQKAWQYQQWGSLPIGQPFGNTTVYVLDAHQQLVPIGVPGMIWVSGIGLANAYLNRPDLTNEKFVHNPFANSPDTARMYDTGDLGQWDFDGLLHYIGRADDQVQVRGIRVELGEIRHALETYPQVQEAYVLAITGQPTRLVAFVQTQDTTDTSDRSGVRKHLMALLPAAMLPDQWVWVDAFPRLPNGKTDRQALLELAENTLPEPENRPATQPQTATERVFAAIWQAVLEQPVADVHQNFFDAGGNSLKAIQIVSRVSAEMGQKLDLRTFFQTPTIAEIANSLTPVSETNPINLQPVAEATDYPASPVQQRIWLAHQQDPAQVAYNMPTSYWLNGPLDTAAFGRAWQALLRRHEVLRTVFVTREGEPRQYIRAVNSADYQLILQKMTTANEVMAHFATTAHTPFDLEQGPLCQLTLVKLTSDRHALQLLVHHTVCDGWSIHLLTHDLIALYVAEVQQTPDPLPALPIQHRDYVAWLLARLDSDEATSARTFWLDQFADAQPLLNLPGAKPRPDRQTFRAGFHSLTVPAHTYRLLQQQWQHQQASAFMGLLTGLNAWLFTQTGQTDFTIGTAVSGRDHVDLEKQVGCFLNTLALRNRFAPTDSVDTLLNQVRAATLPAFAHQLYPFERIVSEQNTPRDRSRNPLFDMGFTFNNQPVNPPAQLAQSVGLEATLLDTDFWSVKCDIWFHGHENEDGLVLNIEYNRDLFEVHRIQQMADDLLTVFSYMGQNPALRLDALTAVLGQENSRRATEQQQQSTNRKRAKLALLTPNS